ncbi:hypothetical protein [Microvirga soli]|uniref:hypothetical protein n=1 Tax=Microvirga soli TaxID=1854496 RepID=UPI0019202B97|nr:hypothetical protein [Microvirga soli]
MDWCRPIGRDRALALLDWGAACHSLGAGPLAVTCLAGFRGAPDASASGRLAAGLRGGSALRPGLPVLAGWDDPIVDYAAAVVALLATDRISVRALASNPTAAASGFGAALTGAEAACDSPARTAAVAATAVVANGASEPSRGPDATSDDATAT